MVQTDSLRSGVAPGDGGMLLASSAPPLQMSALTG